MSGFILCIFLLWLIFHNSISSNSKVIEPAIMKKQLSVDIKGAVVTPGVYYLDEGSVVADAIKESGGLLDIANTDTINLSKKVFDEMVIIIYTKDEIAEMLKGDTSVKVIEKECICPIIENNACINNENKYDNVESSDSYNISSKVSLNSATKEDLMTLKGIGDSKADSIIEYRNNVGLFETIEDLMNVKGIGQSVFEKIKDQITI